MNLEGKTNGDARAREIATCAAVGAEITDMHSAVGSSVAACPLSQLLCPQEGDDGLVYRLVLGLPLGTLP